MWAGEGRHFPLERTEEFLRMNDIDDAVHLRILLLRRALAWCELRQYGMNRVIQPSKRAVVETRSSRLRDVPRTGGRSPNSKRPQADRIRRNGVGSHGELSQRLRVIVATFFAEVLLDDRVGYV